LYDHCACTDFSPGTLLVNLAAVASLRKRLEADLPVHGLWVTLDAPGVSEIAAAFGLDWVVVDAEHGHLDWGDIVAHVRSTVRSGTVCLVRVAELTPGVVKRALDVGADGIVLPRVETPEELERAVSYTRYPPAGIRGVGAERATAWGRCFAEHAADADANLMVVPIIESVAGAERIAELAQVEGVDTFFFGPADFCASAGATGQWETPAVAEQIAHCVQAVREAGKRCGVIATGAEDLARRHREGFRMLGLGLDAGLLIRSLEGMLEAAGVRRELTPSLEPRAVGTVERPLPRPPAGLRPDRSASSCALPDAEELSLGEGVMMHTLVGERTGARGLTTGIAVFEPGARLPYHRHPCGETITLLEGAVAVEVEGRRYALAPLDNVTVPRGLAHQVENVDAERPARLHVALASERPDRELVEPSWKVERMPDDSAGTAGAEHVVRHAAATRYSPGPGTEFVDHLNAELIPGIEMSGGWGRFERGGRLPAHVHDFDESICIVDGTARCVVEGRTNDLDGIATAHVPRGRVHYFENTVDAPMEMIWVYAGPMPERIVVDERCATREGSPWEPPQAKEDRP